MSASSRFLSRVSKRAFAIFDRYGGFAELLASHPDLGPGIPAVAWLSVLSAFSAIAELAAPFLAQTAIDGVFPSKSANVLGVFAGAVAAVYGLSWILGTAHSFLSAHLILKHPLKIRETAFRRCLDSTDFFDSRTASDVAMSLESDASGIIQALLKCQDRLVHSLVTAGGAFVLVASSQGSLAAAVVFFIAASAALHRVISLRGAPHSVRLRSLQSEIHAFCHDCLRKARAVRLSCAESFFSRRYRSMQRRRFGIEKSLLWNRRLDGVVGGGLSIGYKIAIGYFLGRQVILDKISAGEAVFFLILIIKMHAASAGLFSLDRDTLFLSEASRRLKRLLGREKRPDTAPAAVVEDFRDLRFENVGFKYGKRPVFSRLNFDVRAGEKVLFQGPSGVGKTTLFYLLAGMLEPDSGSVSVNGRPLSRIDRKSWYRLCAFVPQDNFLFRAGVRENITLGEPPDDRRFERVLSLSETRFLSTSALRAREELFRGEYVIFSGGEARRIMIARALYREASVVILDEPETGLGEELARKIVRPLTRDASTLIMFSNRKTLESLATRVIRLPPRAGTEVLGEPDPGR